MNIAKIGIAAIILALLIPILGIDTVFMTKVAIYLIIGGVTLFGLALYLTVREDLK
nr:hypothetical protein [uncultured Duncaniella sp.]